MPVLTPPTTPLGRILAEQGRKQTWLAEQAGLSKSYINFVVSGRRPLSRGSAALIAPLLGVDPADLGPVPRRPRARSGQTGVD